MPLYRIEYATISLYNNNKWAQFHQRSNEAKISTMREGKKNFLTKWQRQFGHNEETSLVSVFQNQRISWVQLSAVCEEKQARRYSITRAYNIL